MVSIYFIFIFFCAPVFNFLLMALDVKLKIFSRNICKPITTAATTHNTRSGLVFQTVQDRERQRKTDRESESGG